MWWPLLDDSKVSLHLICMGNIFLFFFDQKLLFSLRLLLIILLQSISCFKLTFLRNAMIGDVEKTLSSVGSTLRKFQCFLIMSFTFGKVWLYVKETGKHDFLSLSFGCSRSFLLRWLTFSVYCNIGDVLKSAIVEHILLTRSIWM